MRIASPITNAFFDGCNKLYFVGLVSLYWLSNATEYACKWSVLRYSQPSTFRKQVLPLVLRKRSRLLTDVLLVCLLDSIAYTKKNDVYTHDSQFSDISGVAKLFCIHIHMPACRILHFNWLKRHGLFAHVFKPHVFRPQCCITVLIWFSSLHSLCMRIWMYILQ